MIQTCRLSCCSTLWKGLVAGFLLLLFTATPTSSLTSRSATTTTTSRSIQVASEILQGLQKSTTTTTSPLDLTTDFFDTSTGLHSEGVWHNCLLGITGLRLFQEQTRQDDNKDNNKEEKDKVWSLHAPTQIAESLFQFSWDGTSFCRRAWSGRWDHSILLSEDATTSIHQADYYRESSEHRCIQHGMSLVFWSLLVQQEQNKDPQDIPQQQQQVIATQFLKEFWNPLAQKWTTVSATQGGGNLLRPSASANKITLGTITEKDSTVPYFRAVDQAVAILGCLEYLQVLKKNKDDNDETANIIKEVTSIISITCQQLLSFHDNGFGYKDVSTARSYIGLNRNRNFWHDGWVLLALIQAHDYISWPQQPENPGDALSPENAEHATTLELLKSTWDQLLDRYGHKDDDTPESLPLNGTVWHWAPSERDDAANVRYCGDNVLCFAIRRSLASLEEATVNDETHNDRETYLDTGFWEFIAALRQDNPMDLSSVADVYPQVRLHPNSELAALLVWP